ncbi:hypothetical protein cyc_03795 [Cyclospora cayetanensis]|uniref:Uncharacterized protein n=1 Tax=Cyclospora cayetanensis TaxID=88456 RepID=A0A1D3D2G8_9EIME|nr:hypothetical protein cyc_03795 [Cyclospora cayetanensis]
MRGDEEERAQRSAQEGALNGLVEAATADFAGARAARTDAPANCGSSLSEQLQQLQQRLAAMRWEDDFPREEQSKYPADAQNAAGCCDGSSRAFEREGVKQSSEPHPQKSLESSAKTSLGSFMMALAASAAHSVAEKIEQSAHHLFKPPSLYEIADRVFLCDRTENASPLNALISSYMDATHPFSYLVIDMADKRRRSSAFRDGPCHATANTAAKTAASTANTDAKTAAGTANTCIPSTDTRSRGFEPEAFPLLPSQRRFLEFFDCLMEIPSPFASRAPAHSTEEEQAANHRRQLQQRLLPRQLRRIIFSGLPAIEEFANAFDGGALCSSSEGDGSDFADDADEKTAKPRQHVRLLFRPVLEVWLEGVLVYSSLQQQACSFAASNDLDGGPMLAAAFPEDCFFSVFFDPLNSLEEASYSATACEGAQQWLEAPTPPLAAEAGGVDDGETGYPRNERRVCGALYKSCGGPSGFLTPPRGEVQSLFVGDVARKSSPERLDLQHWSCGEGALPRGSAGAQWPLREVLPWEGRQRQEKKEESESDISWGCSEDEEDTANSKSLPPLSAENILSPSSTGESSISQPLPAAPPSCASAVAGEIDDAGILRPYSTTTTTSISKNSDDSLRDPVARAPPEAEFPEEATTTTRAAKGLLPPRNGHLQSACHRKERFRNTASGRGVFCCF